MMLNPALRRVLLADTTKLASHATWLFKSSRFGLAQSASISNALTRIIAPCGVAISRQTYATATTPGQTTTRKPRAKSTKKKSKKKAAAAKKKKKPAKRAKKPLSPEKQELERGKSLLQKALLDEPKRLPSTAYTVYTTEARPSGPSSLAQMASDYKSIGPAELERLNHIAVENKERNQEALRAFVEKHTPEQIRSANRARTAIKKLNAARKARGKRSITGSKQKALYKLPDHRPATKRATSPYIEFSRERWASGEFKNMALADAAGQIAREYKSLSQSEKNAYRN